MVEKQFMNCFWTETEWTEISQGMVAEKDKEEREGELDTLWDG